MAVFTTVTQHDINNLISDFTIGSLAYYEGINEGIENTNYRVRTVTDNSPNDEKEYILTLFETIDSSELPFFIDLLTLLHQQGLPVAEPLLNSKQSVIQYIANKPALLFTCLPGRHIPQPTIDQCQSVAKTLANMHNLTHNLHTKKPELNQYNHRGADWWHSTYNKFSIHLSNDESNLITTILESYNQFVTKKSSLPKGIIHGDLFHDNVLFKDNQLTGILDFYNACTDYFIYDLAITVNDWCVKDGGSIDLKRHNYFLAAYQQLRPLTQEEQKAWPLMLQVAALRFWLSRLNTTVTVTSTSTKAMSFTKDPNEFKHILIDRKNNLYSIPK